MYRKLYCNLFVWDGIYNSSHIQHLYTIKKTEDNTCAITGVGRRLQKTYCRYFIFATECSLLQLALEKHIETNLIYSSIIYYCWLKL